MTLFEYKAVRQTGRDPTWNVLGVLSEKNVFFLNKAFADCKCIPDVYEPKMYFQISKSYSISPTVGGCELGGLRSSSPSQGQVHQGAAEVNLDLDEGDLS